MIFRMVKKENDPESTLHKKLGGFGASGEMKQSNNSIGQIIRVNEVIRLVVRVPYRQVCYRWQCRKLRGWQLSPLAKQCEVSPIEPLKPEGWQVAVKAENLRIGELCNLLSGKQGNGSLRLSSASFFSVP